MHTHLLHITSIKTMTIFSFLIQEHDSILACNTPIIFYSCQIPFSTSNQLHLTGFYGEPNTARRHEAWSKLRNLNSQPEKPWLCIGEFNEIVRQDEKLGGARRPHWQMQQFREVINECGFMDLGFEGSNFT